ncbi:PIN domain-containing protein [Marivirga harenae]|uniref:type II toxin-antitoxin system VapC family toxin n=1 Tax=Marivirga harenae TaxID=2010992 RepID=UPI0026DEA951|nr:PIN domain-containing protein [Marivirga harenae]WKV12746.1 PIN domain-containing protein [Marivirga harenae]|tara:strand:- start:14261 stop:14671 length:411 start_codon:yes stop_codon:yes gene_type:complete
MKNILIDAGPLIALFDRGDKYHLKAISFLKSLDRGLLTTWPVITETSHMLNFSTKAQANFLEWIERGGLKIFEMEHEHVNRLTELTKKYDDVPMDLADASLILVSEVKGIHQIASIDSDFYIYRDIRNKYLDNIFL